MAAPRKRTLSFLPQPPAVDPVVGYGSFPLEIGVGELLRMTRERQGQEVQSVANQLRIRLAYLQAIEEGRFRDLPGSTYAVGFVRSYADHLGLDSADVVRRFREEVAKVHGRTKLVFPAVSAEGKIPGAAVILLSAVGAAIVYGAWYYISSREDRNLELIAEVPDRLIALPPGEGTDAPAAVESGAPPGLATVAPSPYAPAAGDTTASALANDAIDVPPPSQAGSDPSGTDASPASGAPDPAVPSSPPAVAAAGGEGPQSALATAPDAAMDAAVGALPGGPAAGAAAADLAAIPRAPAAPAAIAAAPQEAALPPGGEAGIVLEARMDSWIEILDASGQSVIDRILRAGDRYVVPPGTGLLLTTGNAGGLDVFVDGQKAPPLGEVGAVRRRIPLDSAQLLQGAATAE